MVADDDDVDAAVQVHLLQSIHQLADDVVNVPQGVVQLRGGDTHFENHKAHRWTAGRGWNPDPGADPPRYSAVPAGVQTSRAAPSAQRRRRACSEVTGGRLTRTLCTLWMLRDETNLTSLGRCSQRRMVRILLSRGITLQRSNTTTTTTTQPHMLARKQLTHSHNHCKACLRLVWLCSNIVPIWNEVIQ